MQVTCLRTGYRSVTLKNGHSEDVELASLLIHISIKNYMVSKVIFLTGFCMLVISRQIIYEAHFSNQQIVFEQILSFATDNKLRNSQTKDNCEKNGGPFNLGPVPNAMGTLIESHFRTYLGTNASNLNRWYFLGYVVITVNSLCFIRFLY